MLQRGRGAARAAALVALLLPGTALTLHAQQAPGDVPGGEAPGAEVPGASAPEAPAAGEATPDAAPRPTAAPALPTRGADDQAALVQVLRDRRAARLGGFPEQRKTVEKTLTRWQPSARGRAVSITLRKSFSDGVRPALDTVADLGLVWLAAHQSPDGSWSCAGFRVRCGTLTAGICDGVGSPQYDTGVTALALLCFLRAGHGPTDGPFAPVVRDGLRFLVLSQREGGSLSAPEFGQSTYDHIIGTLVLLEALPSDESGTLRDPAARAVEHLLACRSSAKAWRYRAFHPEMQTHPADMSVTGWAIQALVKASEAGIGYDPNVLTEALAFMEDMTDPKTGVTGYYARGERPARETGQEVTWPLDETESMTAVALLCSAITFPNRSYAKGSPVDKRVARVAALPPLWSDEQPGRRDFYYWLHGTEALARFGGTDWSNWKRALVAALVKNVTVEGETTGSWSPYLTAFGSAGGRIFSTSMLVLACIEASTND